MRLTSSLLFAISLFVFSLPSLVSAQEVQETLRPEATVEDLDWIAGHWEGEAMGGTFEETWNRSKGGSMMGMFKFIDGDEIKFYEILTIVPQDKSLLLRLKHFNHDLVGWEAKDKSVEFPLSSISETEARFEGLTFTKINADEMLIVVMTKPKDGQAQELRFECHRVNEPDSNAKKQEIEGVFAVDSVLSKQRDQLPEKHSAALAVTAYVAGLDSIDFSQCPVEFATAFKKHRDAWNDSISFFAKHDQLHGEMHELIEKIRAMDQSVVAELNACLRPIQQSWQEVENQARKHGIE